MRITLSLLSVCFASVLFADSTIDPANKNAYGANIGWVDARADGTNGMVVGEFYCSGYLYSANVGWIHVGDGSPMNGKFYAQNYSADYGINHDGLGNLTGFAYGANIGWINFEQELGKPQVNLKTGELSGFVWSPNVGWIALDTLQAHVRTETLNKGRDNDSDGIPDAWEYRYAPFGRDALNVLSAEADRDGDGVSDFDEYLADTDPTDANDLLLITDLALSDLGQRLTWTSKPTRKYNIEYAAVLNTNRWTEHPATYPTGTTASQLIKGAPTQDARFYRVKVAPPLN